jgi:uncharacterized MAPEG superfamily protein
MTFELKMLVWSAALTLVLAVVSAVGAIGQVGLPALAGNRQGLAEITCWTGRAIRAHRNMLENLILFAIAVIAAKLAGVCNASTVLGAQLFFWGRVAHAAVYVAGIAWVRTAAFAVSVVGLLMILLQLL